MTPSLSPRPVARRNSRVHHRAGNLRDADAARHAEGRAGGARETGAVFRSAWASRRTTLSSSAPHVENEMLNGETIRLDGAIRMRRSDARSRASS